MKISKFKRQLFALGISMLSVVAMAQQQAYVSPAGTKFLLYTPPGYSSSTSDFPLLLSLHSKGEVGDDLEELTSKNPEQMPSRLIYLNRWPADLPFIVLTPQLRPEEGDPDSVWGPQWPAEYIDEVVRHVTANFKVDVNRIYVTGISKGGIGTWTYASAYPEKVAAILPISGRSDLTKACSVKDIPTWVFHGDGDEVVIPEYSINMVNAIKECAPSGIFKPRLNIMHARDHNGWNEVYNQSSGYKIYEWLLMFRKGDISNKNPYVNTGPDLKIALRSDPLHLVGDFFDWDGTITNVTWRQTGGSPLILENTGSEFLKITGLKTGVFEFELIVTDDRGGQSSDKVTLEITDSSVTPSISQLVLLDGKTGAEIGSLSEGQIINRSALKLSEVNVNAIASDGTASVVFTVNADQNTRSQNSGPYLIKRQTTFPEWKVSNGTYLICATPYAKPYSGGSPGVSQCYKVAFTEDAGPEPCQNLGKITHEKWTGVPGTTVSSIPVNDPPTSTGELTIFEGPTNSGDNYAARIRGYICPPVSGDYVFWIAGDDHTELWLSTSEHPANKRRIANVSGWTSPRQWTKYTSQQSATIPLVANQKYYIEALHKEGTGGDNVAVGWQLPGGSLERPIPGMRLIPFGSSGTVPPVVSLTSPEDGEAFTAPATIGIAATASDPDGTITKVEFYNGTAKLGEDLTSPYTFNWNNVSSGNYMLQARAITSDGATATASVDISVTTGGCVGDGTITHEQWNGISGVTVSTIPVNEQPDFTGELTLFEIPSHTGDNYATRIRGYICPPVSGNYIFWISGDDHTELWLSTNDNPANKQRIASMSGWTTPRQWTKYPSQQSAPIALTANQTYYIEALHKEAAGGDHVAVGWQLPGGLLERPIPGSRLSPYEATALMVHGAATARQTTDLESTLIDGTREEITVFPNPAPSGFAGLTIYRKHETDKSSEQTIEIIAITGEVIRADYILERESHGDRLIINRLERQLQAGVYIINVITDGRRSSGRLFVK